MNTSVCITVLNEEKSIAALLDSLLHQSKKPNEIIIVDGGSKDRTLEIIRHYQKKASIIKILKEKCSRSRGRNLAVEIAKSNIIAMTDAGCVADSDWLLNITKPFEIGHTDVVAGFYKMVAKNNIQKAMSVFLGVAPKNFDDKFLPSTRSVAFTKDVWEKVGGFPEKMAQAAEDTVFNYMLIKNKEKFSRMKNALVEWGMPSSIYNFYVSIYNYAKGDAKSKIWYFPEKNLMSHNIHSLFLIFRYAVLVGLLAVSVFFNSSLFSCWLVLLFLYFFWSFYKVYLKFPYVRVAAYGPVLQIVSDFAVINGFISGIIGSDEPH